MTSEEFVTGITRVVYESAVKDTMSFVQKPPGRRPPERLAALSKWFAGFPDSDKAQLETLVALAARQAVFGLLAVVDGVRQIEDTPMKGSFELWFSKGEERVLLNAPDAEYLHELFNRDLPTV